MIHLKALPGAPRYEGSMDDIVDRAVADAESLTESGFQALLIENYGDAPFYPESVPPVTVSAMTTAINEIRRHTTLPIGINVLRNDASSAVSIAAVTGASFVRVNVLSGVMYTDQGPIVGKAHEIHRDIEALGSDTAVWADVMVKHSVPPPGLDIARATMDTVERGLADAVIVSGSGTGTEPDFNEMRLVRNTLPEEVPLVVGSGASTANLHVLARIADSAIVGSALKPQSNPENPIDRELAERFAKKASDLGWV